MLNLVQIDSFHFQYTGLHKENANIYIRLCMSNLH
jgi:hypothetical protein